VSDQPQSDKPLVKLSRKVQITIMLIGVAPLFLGVLLKHLIPHNDHEFWGLFILTIVVAPIFLLYVIAIARAALQRLRR
jgi:hypothetical protein